MSAAERGGRGGRGETSREGVFGDENHYRMAPVFPRSHLIQRPPVGDLGRGKGGERRKFLASRKMPKMKHPRRVPPSLRSSATGRYLICASRTEHVRTFFCCGRYPGDLVSKFEQAKCVGYRALEAARLRVGTWVPRHPKWEPNRELERVRIQKQTKSHTRPKPFHHPHRG